MTGKVKKFVLFLMVAAAVFAMASAASAANWRKVYGDRDVIIHVDTSSVRSHGNTFEVKERWYYNSYQTQAEMGLIAAFSPATLNQKNVDVVYHIVINEYKKNASSRKRLDGAMFNRKGKVVCPLNGGNWADCCKEEEAVRRAVKAMKGWK